MVHVLCLVHPSELTGETALHAEVVMDPGVFVLILLSGIIQNVLGIQAHQIFRWDSSHLLMERLDHGQVMQVSVRLINLLNFRFHCAAICSMKTQLLSTPYAQVVSLNT